MFGSWTLHFFLNSTSDSSSNTGSLQFGPKMLNVILNMFFLNTMSGLETHQNTQYILYDGLKLVRTILASNPDKSRNYYEKKASVINYIIFL